MITHNTPQEHVKNILTELENLPYKKFVQRAIEYVVKLDPDKSAPTTSEKYVNRLFVVLFILQVNTWNQP